MKRIGAVRPKSDVLRTAVYPTDESDSHLFHTTCEPPGHSRPRLAGIQILWKHQAQANISRRLAVLVAGVRHTLTSRRLSLGPGPTN